ncbi:tRNA (N6-threonylcarbamoyladenosine(37)-N6)-methyltransferase TrmO [Propionivibrio dicarboxylicus]|uniref:tRNA-Thr(GGU) m(6)t(6)A37 methyltransferase TsaA n=1 Tax=Propionivibrio dicarboxylicus TaxID=83767 RepID=A0A1G8F068_9RHOO|nr:tRNA (N6-threonylcarbamoyladenosine(37)-N6)-methyltransferase TrmO [Propionivibrio dicarboxylicus]SDH75538.1 tRNA-Thr(GGU) m(6)t(6)A37 methyltransferase TsaA [Propionivibrio dicarboxylicus]
MTKRLIAFTPIGFIHSEHICAERTPIQPVFARECEGRIEILPEFAEGLLDLDGFSHVHLIYYLDRAERPRLKVRPFLQDVERGIFATRYPARPNAIGLSVVELLRIEGCILHFRGSDILDGSPLLDIKPFTARFDHIQSTRNGWYDEVDAETAQRRGVREYFKGNRP